MTKLPPAIVQAVMGFLVQTGELVVVDEKVVLHREILEQSRQKLVEYLTRQGTIDAGAFKDLIGATRKYAIPLLEYWDSKGLTKRVGDTRVLREKKEG
jgi:selenocysteine-specific elongation factor